MPIINNRTGTGGIRATVMSNGLCQYSFGFGYYDSVIVPPTFHTHMPDIVASVRTELAPKTSQEIYVEPDVTAPSAEKVPQFISAGMGYL